MSGWALVLRRRPELAYRIVLVVAFLAAVALRVPATVQELPPFQFCDETIFSGEIQRMIADDRWTTREFRSGGFNIYPILPIARLLAGAGLLDTTTLLLLGRWFYAVLLSSAALLLVAGSARALSGRRVVGIIAAGLFLLSPSLPAVSRYWYPDHYAVFFSALLVYLMVRLLRDEPARWRSRLLVAAGLGGAFGAALSVKYTFSIAGLPVAITLAAGVLRPGGPLGRLGRTLLECVVAAAGAVVVVLVFNFSAVLDPGTFQAGFDFNVQNYARPGGGPSGIVFYAFLLFVAALGVLGIAGLVAGTVAYRSSPIVLLVLLSFPLVNVVYLGLQGLVFNRNIIASIPFLLPLTAIGIDILLRRRGRGLRARTVIVGLALAAGLQVAQVAGNWVLDLAPDSEPAATAWLRTHVPAAAVVGTNGTCSASTAAVAGLRTVDDPDLQQGLDYYVINSYWESALDVEFRGPAAARAALERKYLHYSFANDRTLPQAVFTLPWQVLDPMKVAPAGYRVVTVFDSNGPTIVVLRRIG